MGEIMIVDRMGVVFDMREGARRLSQERSRCAAILAAATAPDDCGPAIPVAPARVAQVAFMPRVTEVTDVGSIRTRRDGWMGRRAVRVGDAFDVMREQALRAHRRAGGDAVFAEPFSGGQEQAGRDYAALAERVDASGMKCASLEAVRSGGGSGRGLSEAVADDMRRLKALHRRIGDGIAKDKLRPSRGGMRSAITVRRLVDMVCLQRKTLDDVIKGHGWAVDTRVRAVLRCHLRAALDRMQGYDLARGEVFR